ncbi:tRNA lysidine(34) synthetase TilS [Porcipelethomonas sp.]|uniref:tRNA lysidine(34) synthetase TilS n=1 Tax=Porcipelethomonas sp. TaxID=2981675 RepID=UPI003EFA8AFF
MLTDRIIETIRTYSMINKGDNVTAALSGGADSVCLLLALKELSEPMGFTVDAIHINHCIRGAESDRDEQFCRDLCKKLEIPLTINRSDVPKHAKEWGKSIEEAARDIRYSYFAEHLLDSDKIATAHTASDNAETMLLNLIRGTGLKGLCGIPPVRGSIIRPLIDITRQQVEEYLKEKNQDYVTDSTNLSDDYTRNRIRHKIIPEILEINSGFYKTFAAETDIFREENEFISKTSDKAYDDCLKNGRLVDADKFPKAIRRRMTARFLKSNDIPESYEKINEVSNLSENDGKINIKKGIYITCKNGVISVEHEREKPEDVQVPLKPGWNSIFEGRVLIAEENNCGEALIDLDKVHGHIVLRNRRYGDKIRLSGRSFTSSVKKLLNENIPSDRRSTIHFLADDEGLIYAETFGVADRVKVTGETTRILSVKTEDVI